MESGATGAWRGQLALVLHRAGGYLVAAILDLVIEGDY